uniref:polyprenyl synthetase family protein n=1 Tax=Erwinia citreus TaxID=558 RepID=UPI00289FD3F7
VLDRYADAIGLAFQVQDDILDVVGDTAIIGKRQGADQQLGKSTYPALMGLERAQAKAWELCQESLSALEILAAQGFDTTSLQALASYIIERNK